MLKAGVIGLGVGENHIDGYRNTGYCEVTKICDINPAVEEAARKKYPEIEFTRHAMDILEDPDIDVVSIASYDDAHFEQIKAGLLHNKHLFIEKPIVQRRHEAEEIARLLKDRPDVKIGSNLILRKLGRFHELKQLMENKAFGELSFINAGYHYGRLLKITEGWRSRIDDYSVVLGGGIHMVDLLLWLSQDRVESVYASGNKMHTRNSPFENFDMVTAVLNFSSGLKAHLVCNFGSVSPHYHQLEIFGTDKSFISNAEGAFIYNDRDVKNGEFNYLVDSPEFPKYKGKEDFSGDYRTISKGDFLSDFVDNIRGEKDAPFKRNEILDALSVCLAIEASAQQDKKLNVEYLTH